MSDIIVNRVSESGLVSLDLEKYLPDANVVVFDMKEHLFMELILKEKDFRESMKNMDWEKYTGQYVAVTCSADAIIPVWAYMLVVSYLQPFAKDAFLGTEEEMHKYIFLKNIASIDINAFADQRIVVKGCGEKAIGDFAYLEITKLLRPVAKTIMYGEPCSTVPIFKKR
jgi:hypothetical protein